MMSDMANTKTGLNYFTIDTDRYQDRRIKRLKKNLGCKGLAVYDYILCETYRVRGCFLEWDDNTVFDVAEYFRLDENTVREIVKYCGAVGLFDKALLANGIITSASIQRRYTEMCTRAKRKAVVIPEKYRVIDEFDDKPAKPKPSQTQPVCQTPTEPSIPFEPYTLTLEQEIIQLAKDEIWLDGLQTLHHMDKEQLRKKLDEFKVQCVADGKQRHQSLQDAKQHYNSWLRIVNNKNRKNDDNQSERQSKRRGNILSADETKTYGGAF